MSASMAVDGGRRTGWWGPALTCLILGIVLFGVSRTFADADLWGHVRFGQDILRTGRIVTPDPYSYLTEGQEWVNHEWLAEVIFAGAFNAAGPLGLTVLKTAIGFLILGLIYRHLGRQGLDEVRSGLLLLAVTVLFLPGLRTVRPHLFTYLLFLLVLLLIEAFERGRRRWLWAAPLLFAVWPNLHGGFLAGLTVLLVWSGVSLAVLLWRERQPGVLLATPARTVILAGVGSVLATLVNPYGPGLFVFLLRTATVPRPEIAEWLPIRIMTKEGAAYVLLLAVAGIGLAFSRRVPGPAVLAVLAGMAIAPLAAYRHSPLFAAAVAVLAAAPLADAWQRWMPATSGQAPPLLGGVALAAAVVLAGLALTELPCVRIPPRTFPARAAALLRDSGVEGNLAVDFDWGEYVIWHLGPRVQVSMDGRRETVYSGEVYEEHLRFLFGQGDWAALVDRPATNLALVSKAFPAFNLMKLKPGWLLVYEDGLCGLFVREGSSAASALRQTKPADAPEDAAGACFPALLP